MAGFGLWFAQPFTRSLMLVLQKLKSEKKKKKNSCVTLGLSSTGSYKRVKVGEAETQVRDRGGNGTQPSFPSSPLFSRDEVNLTQPDWRKAPDTFKVIVTVAFAGKLYSMS